MDEPDNRMIALQGNVGRHDVAEHFLRHENELKLALAAARAVAVAEGVRDELGVDLKEANADEPDGFDVGIGISFEHRERPDTDGNMVEVAGVEIDLSWTRNRFQNRQIRDYHAVGFSATLAGMGTERHDF